MNELLIVSVIVLIYIRSLGFDFISTWEDPTYKVELPKRIRGTFQPLRDFSFWIDQKLWGIRPYGSFGGHLQNILWYVGTCLVVYKLLFYLDIKGVNRLMITLLFTVHPLHAECISWVAGRKFVMMGFFFFLALLLHLKGNEWLAYGSYVMACLSQPSAVVLPVILLWTDYCFGEKMEWLVYGAYFIPLIAMVLYYWKTTYVLKFKNYYEGGLKNNILRMSKIFLLYLGDFIAPFALCAKYGDFRPTKWNWLYLGIIIGIFGLFLAFFEKSLFFYGAGFFVICLLPANNIVFPMPCLKADRFIYLGTFGLCLLVSGWINWWFIIVLAIVAYRQNLTWRDDISVWEHAIRVDSTDIAHNNLGCAYLRCNMVNNAELIWRRLLECDPKHKQAWENFIITFSR